MYCHGDACRFECLRIQFGTTHADQNPGTNVSPCIFAPFLYIRSVPQVTLHIRKLGLFQLQHECSHRYICWHCHILRGDKTKIRSKHIYIHTWVQHSSILARAETSETWKTSCPPGMEGLGSAWTRASLNPGAAWSQRHSDKHTTTGCTAYASSGRIFTEN